MHFSHKSDFAASTLRIAAFWERAVIDRPVVQFKLYKPPEVRRPLPPSRHDLRPAPGGGCTWW